LSRLLSPDSDLAAAITWEEADPVSQHACCWRRNTKMLIVSHRSTL
jgi:hypothetical protein